MSTNNLLNFQTTSQGILPIKLCVLDCDGIIFNSNQLKTAAYRSTLSDLNCSTEEISKFVELHLSDVSVSRFVKFTAFFKDILNDPDSETKTTAALEGYSTNCMKLYKELTPEKIELILQLKSENYRTLFCHQLNVLLSRYRNNFFVANDFDKNNYFQTLRNISLFL